MERSLVLLVRFFLLIMLFCGCRSAAVQQTYYYVKSPPGTASQGNNTLRNTNPEYVNKYRRIETYIPSDSTPVKIVMVSFHIFTGPGSIQDTPGHRAALVQMLDWVNTWYRRNAEPSDPIEGVAFIADTKIRFELSDRIYFYDNTKLQNSCNAYQMQKTVMAVDSSRMNSLNIYFTNGRCTQSSIPPYPGFDYYMTSTGLNGNQHVLMPVPVPPNYASAQTLAHELGHALDLMHTYEHSCCHETCDTSSTEYLDDLFGREPKKSCWQDGGWSCDPNDPTKTCTNNMMSGTALIAYYFTPKQIGKMHRALSIKTAMKYVRDDVYSGEPYYISRNELWDFDSRWYSDIVIKKGVTLTLKGKLTIPPNCAVIVKKGGQLVIDGGSVVHAGELGQPAAIRQRR